VMDAVVSEEDDTEPAQTADSSGIDDDVADRLSSLGYR